MDANTNSMSSFEAVRSEEARPAFERVVMLTCQYSEILGGAEKQCSGLVDGLREAGLDVIVLTSRVPGVAAPRQETGVKRFATLHPPQLAGRYLLSSFIWAIQAFAWVLWNRNDIAVLHCHQLRINAYVAALAHKLLGIPTIMKLGVGGERNDFYIIGRRKYLFGRVGARFVARHSTRVIATSQQIAKDSETWGVPLDRIVRIPNGVDLSLARTAVTGREDPRRETLAAEVRLVFLGRLSEEKNIEAIARAVCSLPDGKPVVLEILGDGPLADKIEALSPVSKDVTIVMRGQVSNVFDCLRRAHFLLMVSSSEGLSNALLEAASTGVVPITSGASGNHDVLPFEAYPFFVCETSPEEIAVAIGKARALSPEDWSRWSIMIATSTRDSYGAELVRDKYIALYRDLVREDSRRGKA